ncbi:MAG: SPASM domain-containing protein, partial [Candidatus Muiribacteriaceae bacterium]
SSCGLDRIEMQQFMFECYRKYGIKDMNFYPRSTYSSCSAITLHSYVLGPEGELYKCWRDIGRKEMIVGSIDGSIPTNNTLLAKYLVDINPYTSDKCGDCFFLPLCNGGCPNLRYRNKYEGTSFDTCMIHKQDLNGFLETYYEIKKGMEK